jgi:hypothetical protein
MTCCQLCITHGHLITWHLLLGLASVSIWHHIQQTFDAIMLFWTFLSFCYMRQSSASCVSVEVKMVVCLLSWKRFEKILLYTGLALDIADGDDSDMEICLWVAWNVWEAISSSVLGEQGEDEAFDLGTVLRSGNDACTLSYWVVLHLTVLYSVSWFEISGLFGRLILDCTSLTWKLQLLCMGKWFCFRRMWFVW